MRFGLSPKTIALLKNPTAEGAAAVWRSDLFGEPKDPTVPLAAIHKARLKWPESTKKMVRESKEWLRANGYGTDPRGPSSDVPMAADTRKPQ